MKHSRRIRLLLAVLGAVAALSAGVARAQDYDLEFTLPTAGKSGCMVCHGDRNLIRPMGKGFVSYFVDGAVLDGSAHAKIMCTGCHTDFAFKAPHGTTDWRANAKLACKNCHQDQFTAYSAGVHSISVKPGTAEAAAVRGTAMASRAGTATAREATASAPASGSAAATRSASATASAGASASVTATGSSAEKPLCGDCHGAHDIEVLEDNPAGQLRLHRQGYEVCGRCHRDWWDSYADYYHGAAFKKGTKDAPACWDCHGWHEIRPSDDRRSGVSDANLVETCARCHKSAGEKFVVATRDMIHGRADARQENPVYAAYSRVRDAIAGLFGRRSD